MRRLQTPVLGTATQQRKALDARRLATGGELEESAQACLTTKVTKRKRQRDKLPTIDASLVGRQVGVL